MLNPDVLTREMGVMEKCTFCVQRIRDFKDNWRDQKGVNRLIGQQEADVQGSYSTNSSDYARVTACAAACPSGAITFGNLKDEKSEVYAKFNDKRSFIMLEELNNKPGVAYMTRIVHTKSKLHHGGGHGDEGSHHNDNNHKTEEHH